MPEEIVEYQNPRLHDFLAEELAGLPSHTDGNRMRMFGHNVKQALELPRGEFPNFFTGYERVIWGDNGYQTTPDDVEIVSIVQKNKFVKMVFFKTLSDNTLDCIEVCKYQNFTEKYGYEVNSELGHSITAGDRVPKGTVLWHSSNYDKNLNPLVGINLNTAYLSWGNKTYQDAVVISESAAQKLSTDRVSVVYITINTNDMPLPIYSNDRFMPDIGESIRDYIVMAIRRWSAEELLTDFTRERMMTVNPIKDTCVYNTGTIVDVEIFNNCPENKWNQLLVNPQLNQLNDLQRQQNKYYVDCLDTIEPYVQNNLPRTANVDYYYGRFRRAVNPDIFWQYDGRKFDFVVLKMTVTDRTPLSVGGKLVNRHGGKGCVSEILADYDPDPVKQKKLGRRMMPVGEDGTPIEMILNPLGIVGRMNPSALYEIELNRIAEQITRLIFQGKCNIQELIGMLSVIDEDWGRHISEKFARYPDEVMNSLGKYGPHVRVKPFWNNLNINVLGQLYDQFPVAHPTRLYIPYLGTHTRRKVSIGKSMTMRLKHDPYTKLTVRGAGSFSSKGLPGKNKAYNSGIELNSTTPVRLGSQEQINMMLMFGDEPHLLKRFLNSRSINPEDRATLAAGALQGRMDELTPEDFDRTGSINTAGLRALLTTIGVEFVPDEDSNE